jgi:hypothetical protein
MSDFLTRLVERTLGLSEPVQPIITPVFFNQMATGDDFAVTRPEDENGPVRDQRTGPSQMRHAETSSLQAVSPSKRQVPEEAIRVGVSDDSLPDSRADAMYGTRTPSQRDQVLSRPQARRDVPPPAGEPEHNDQLACSGNVREVTTVQSGPPERLTVSGTLAASADTSDDVRDRPVAEQQQMCTVHRDLVPNEKTPLRTVATVRESQRPVLSAGPQGTGRTKGAASGEPLTLERFARPEGPVRMEPVQRAPRDHPCAERGVPSTPPTIKVTIGRIDVRAVNHQAPLPARARPVTSQLKLSLQEYLNQRNKGHR